ncbi:MAG: PEP-CTERM sorting domain-containing protein [Verrucomicrobiota bacterium]
MALAGAASANLLTNPGFETGDLTGWDAAGWYTQTGGDAHSGTWGAGYHVLSGAPNNDFYVALQYVPVTANASYDFAGWLRFAGLNESESFLEVVFIDNLGAWGGQYQSVHQTTTEGYTLYSITNMIADGDAVTARVAAVVHTTALTTDQSWHNVDDMSFDQTIPEPTTLGLLGMAVAGMIVLRRKNRA